MAASAVSDAKRRMNPIAKVFLEGVYDDGSNLSRLRGLWHILKEIWRHVRQYWELAIGVPMIDTQLTESYYNDVEDVQYIRKLGGPEHWTQHNIHELVYTPNIEFPKPKDINVNMMPFILAYKFKDTKLPGYLKEYHNEIVTTALCSMSKDAIGSIGYITVQESLVRAETSQRRPGLHTESPGELYINLPEPDAPEKEITITSSKMGEGTSLPMIVGWGVAKSYSIDEHTYLGGIFTASNCPNSCQAWNCRIIDDKAIGTNGDIEHMRGVLNSKEIKSFTLKPNRLYWLTDRTPHESLPLPVDTHRQFFRLVVGEVSVWFEDHSSPNPNGVVPDPNATIIVRGSKFAKQGVIPVKQNLLTRTLAQMANKFHL